MAKLILKFESSVIKEINLDKSSCTIGRKPDNDITLDHTTVSGHHCKVYNAGGTFFVEDLGSTNGTFLNGKKIVKSAGLRQNDAIGIVKYTLVFVEEGKKAGDIPESTAIKSVPPKAQKRVKAFLSKKSYMGI